jgi:hypothetical protein
MDGAEGYDDSRALLSASEQREVIAQRAQRGLPPLLAPRVFEQQLDRVFARYRATYVE